MKKIITLLTLLIYISAGAQIRKPLTRFYRILQADTLRTGLTSANTNNDTGFALLTPGNIVVRGNRFVILSMLGALSSNDTTIVRTYGDQSNIGGNKTFTGSVTYNGSTGPLTIDGGGGYTYLNLGNGSNYIRRTGATYAQALRFPAAPTGNWDYQLQDKGGTLAFLTDINNAATIVSNTTTTLLYSRDYSFTGSSPTTWTLPAVSSTMSGRFYAIYIKNRGTAVLTIVTNVSGTDIYGTAAVNTLDIMPGGSITLTPDGTYFTY